MTPKEVDHLPLRTRTNGSRRRERPLERARRLDAGDLPQRVARVREEVFALVTELRRTQAAVPGDELEGAVDQMQSIANRLGAVEEAFSSSGR